jgi:hypothetical protein
MCDLLRGMTAVLVCLGLLLAGELRAATVAERPPDRIYPNLIYNPSFEAPDWWNAAQAEFWYARAVTARDTTEFRTGATSLRIHGPNNGYTLQGGMSLLPNTRYRLSGWIKTRGVTGGGISLFYGQTSPGGQHPIHTQSVRGNNDWTEVTAKFTTPADHVSGMVRIVWDLKEGEVGWVDDVSLVPEDGKVPVAPAPAIIPNGGTFAGPMHVTLVSQLPGSTIYYTIDGSEPHHYSTRYTIPFWIAGSVTVKAKVIHAGYQDSPVAQCTFTLQPAIGEGVPFYPVGWQQDVASWWAGHPYNPGSPNALKSPIPSPAPRINVAEVWAKHPKSTTAGIEEALALLPQAGGTLWFPKDKGPYVVTKPIQATDNYYKGISGAILVLKRSNLHFLSDGATISAPYGIFCFSSMQHTEQGTLQNPVRNFYFNNIVFDGQLQSHSAMLFNHCSDILFDDCIFRNYIPRKDQHPGCINAHAMTDNIWCRNTRFESGHHGVYWDGVHGGGFVTCFFGKGVERARILLLTNNDMVFFSPAQRTCQYIVVEGCTFEGPGQYGIGCTAANVLVSNNRFTGHFQYIVQQTGRGMSNMQRYTRYDGSGFMLLGNTVESVTEFYSLLADATQTTRRDTLTMQHLLRGNTVGRATAMLSLNPGGEYQEIGQVVIADNTFGGPAIPQVRVAPGALSRLGPIRISGNTFSGKDSHIPITDLTGRQPVAFDGVTRENNRVESTDAK